MRQRALFTGRCIAPTLGGANGVQLSCFPMIPHHNPHHTQRQLTMRVDLPTRLWRTEVWRRSCGSELCSPVAASPPHWAEQAVSSSFVHRSLHRPHIGRSKRCPAQLFRCKRSSPGDTPAHVLVSHSWPHFCGASDPPSCEPPALKELACLLALCRACTFAARRMLRARSLLLGRAGRQNGRETHLLLVSVYLRRHSFIIHDCRAPVVESRHFGVTQATFARAPLAGVEVMMTARVRPLFHIPHSTFHFVAFRQMTHNEPLAPLGRVQDTSPTAHNRNISHRHRHCRRCPCS